MALTEKKAVVVQRTMESLIALAGRGPFSNYHTHDVQNILSKLSMDDLWDLDNAFEGMWLSTREAT